MHVEGTPTAPAPAPAAQCTPSLTAMGSGSPAAIALQRRTPGAAASPPTGAHMSSPAACPVTAEPCRAPQATRASSGPTAHHTTSAQCIKCSAHQVAARGPSESPALTCCVAPVCTGDPSRGVDRQRTSRSATTPSPKRRRAVRDRDADIKEEPVCGSPSRRPCWHADGLVQEPSTPHGACAAEHARRSAAATQLASEPVVGGVECAGRGRCAGAPHAAHAVSAVVSSAKTSAVGGLGPGALPCMRGTAATGGEAPLWQRGAGGSGCPLTAAAAQSSQHGAEASPGVAGTCGRGGRPWEAVVEELHGVKRNLSMMSRSGTWNLPTATWESIVATRVFHVVRRGRHRFQGLLASAAAASDASALAAKLRSVPAVVSDDAAKPVGDTARERHDTVVPRVGDCKCMGSMRGQKRSEVGQVGAGVPVGRGSTVEAAAAGGGTSTGGSTAAGRPAAAGATVAVSSAPCVAAAASTGATLHSQAATASPAATAAGTDRRATHAAAAPATTAAVTAGGGSEAAVAGTVVRLPATAAAGEVRGAAVPLVPAADAGGCSTTAKPAATAIEASSSAATAEGAATAACRRAAPRPTRPPAAATPAAAAAAPARSNRSPQRLCKREVQALLADAPEVLLAEGGGSGKRRRVSAAAHRDNPGACRWAPYTCAPPHPDTPLLSYMPQRIITPCVLQKCAANMYTDAAV